MSNLSNEPSGFAAPMLRRFAAKVLLKVAFRLHGDVAAKACLIEIFCAGQPTEPDHEPSARWLKVLSRCTRWAYRYAQ